MPAYCSEHATRHLTPEECDQMRGKAQADRAAAERRAQAERHARQALDTFAYLPGDRLSFARALEVATKAAETALARTAGSS